MEADIFHVTIINEVLKEYPDTWAFYNYCLLLGGSCKAGLTELAMMYYSRVMLIILQW